MMEPKLFWSTLVVGGVLLVCVAVVIQNHSSSSAVETTSTSDFINILMDETCAAIGSKRDTFFDSPKAPSLFVIYAHNNPNCGKADDRKVKKIIKYLGVIGAKARSDRRPILHSPDEESAPLHDILDNQFCLLPKGFTTNPVDKVLLCFSEVFHKYCEDADSKKYVESVTKAGLEEAHKFDGHEDCIRSVQAAIRKAVENGRRISKGFHHVLTEVALLQVRVELTGNRSIVIPVNLHRINEIHEDLPFLRTTPYLVPPPPEAIQYHHEELLHSLFFNILSRIYDSGPPLVKVLEKRYKIHVKMLRERKWSEAEFRSEISKDIRKHLEDDNLYRDLEHQLSSVQPLLLAGQGTAEIAETSLESKCLDKLAFASMGSREKEVVKEIKLAKTCNWIIQEANGSYFRWRNRHDLDNNKGLFWIKGHPGSGKSVATKKVLEAVKQEERKLGTAATVLSYFFNARSKEPLDKNMMGMLRTLVHQLLDKETTLRSRFTNDNKTLLKTEGAGFEPGVLKKFFETVISSPRPRPIHLIVDAIDECEPSERLDTRSFLTELPKTALEHGCVLSICISVREDTALAANSQTLQLHIQDGNSDDIQSHVRNTLEGYSSGEELNLMVQEIQHRSSTNFLWADVVAKRIRKPLFDGVEHPEIVLMIQQLPKEIKDLFREVLLHLNQEEKREACALFQWVLFGTGFTFVGRAERNDLIPLQYAVILANKEYMSFAALGEEHGELHRDKFSRRINYLSGGLIECIEQPLNSRRHKIAILINDKPESIFSHAKEQVINESVKSTIVQVIHGAVEEWFKDEGCQVIDDSLSSGNVSDQSHAVILKCCTTVLDDADFANTWNRACEKDGPRNVASYAGNYILFHAQELDRKGEVPMAFLERLAPQENLFWTNLITAKYYLAPVDSIETERRSSPLNTLCSRGFTTSIAHLLTHQTWIDHVNSETLISAISSREINTLRVLLCRYKLSDIAGATNWACHKVVAKWIGVLQKSPAAPVFTPDKDTLEGFFDVIDLLQSKGAQINAVDSDAENLLCFAIRKMLGEARIQIVQGLIERGAHTILKDAKGKVVTTALHGALSRSHYREKEYPLGLKELTEILLKADKTQLNARDSLGISPLHLATARETTGKEGPLDVLLKAGASIDLLDSSKHTPLAMAVAVSSNSAVDKLLKHGANPTISNQFNQTPLDRAMSGLPEYAKERLESALNKRSASQFSVKCLLPDLEPPEDFQYEFIRYYDREQVEATARIVIRLSVELEEYYQKR